VTYHLQASRNLRDWEEVPAWARSERIVRRMGDWDEVEVAVIDEPQPGRFFRVAVREA
jgi:hypothetical protein